MSSKAILEQYVKFLETKELKYKWDKDNDVLITSFSIDSKLGSIREFIFAQQNEYTVLARCALHADKESIPLVAEYLLRANYGLKYGNFQMDFDDGEILYRYTQRTCDVSLTDEEIERSIIIPLAMFSRYGNGLVKVMFTLSTPEEAISEAESEALVEVDAEEHA